MLKKVEGLENLSDLTTLHLRDNHIETLSGFSKEMQSLQYLNLRYGSFPSPTLHLPLAKRSFGACACPISQCLPTVCSSPQPS